MYLFTADLPDVLQSEDNEILYEFKSPVCMLL